MLVRTLRPQERGWRDPTSVEEGNEKFLIRVWKPYLLDAF